MTTKVYGDSISGNYLKVKWTLEYLHLPYDWIETDILKGESRSEHFLALNSAGQVPTVVLEGGRPLAQSNAIIVHLAEGTALIPADAYQRAKMFEWLFWDVSSQSHTNPHLVANCRSDPLYVDRAVHHVTQTRSGFAHKLLI